jgi:hypothetical protein
MKSGAGAAVIASGRVNVASRARMGPPIGIEVQSTPI